VTPGDHLEETLFSEEYHESSVVATASVTDIIERATFALLMEVVAKTGNDEVTKNTGTRKRERGR